MGTKRYISLLLGLLMMFTLTACDGGKATDRAWGGRLFYRNDKLELLVRVISGGDGLHSYD